LSRCGHFFGTRGSDLRNGFDQFQGVSTGLQLRGTQSHGAGLSRPQQQLQRVRHTLGARDANHPGGPLEGLRCEQHLAIGSRPLAALKAIAQHAGLAVHLVAKKRVERTHVRAFAM
jgi:hypothetical protein